MLTLLGWAFLGLVTDGGQWGGVQIWQSYTLPKDKNIYKSRETPL